MKTKRTAWNQNWLFADEAHELHEQPFPPHTELLAQPLA